MNKKILAHVKDLKNECSFVQEGFLILAYVSNPNPREIVGRYTWLAVESDMLNRWDTETYATPEEAKDAITEYFGADNVVFEPFKGLEVY